MSIQPSKVTRPLSEVLKKKLQTINGKIAEVEKHGGDATQLKASTVAWMSSMQRDSSEGTKQGKSNAGRNKKNATVMNAGRNTDDEEYEPSIGEESLSSYSDSDADGPSTNQARKGKDHVQAKKRCHSSTQGSRKSQRTQEDNCSPNGATLTLPIQLPSTQVEGISETLPQPSVHPTPPTDETNQHSTPCDVERNMAPSSSSKRKRGPTKGKSLEKVLAQDPGKKLPVIVPEEMNAYCGLNATLVATDLGVLVRLMCPIQGFASSWKYVDPMTRAAIKQASEDKFDVQDGTEEGELANAVFDKKASLLYKDWKCRMRGHWRQLRRLRPRVDVYSRPYSGVSKDDWKYLIDYVFKDPKIQSRCKAGKKNRKKLPYNHTMGSKSFPAALSTEPAAENGVPDFCDFYEKSHKLKETEQWIDPICEEH